MSDNILDAQVKGVSIRIIWQVLAGWTTIVFTILFTYYSLKQEIQDSALEQVRIDAIQDLRLDGMKRDIELQNLQIKDLNERFGELKNKQNEK